MLESRCQPSLQDQGIQQIDVSQTSSISMYQHQVASQNSIRSKCSTQGASFHHRKHKSKSLSNAQTILEGDILIIPQGLNNVNITLKQYLVVFKYQCTFSLDICSVCHMFMWCLFTFSNSSHPSCISNDPQEGSTHHISSRGQKYSYTQIHMQEV